MMSIIKYIKPQVKNLVLLILLLSFCNSNAQITTYPYSEGFEFGLGGWSSLGTNNSWELGNPSGFIINSAALGTMAWVTNLDSEYADNENGYVQSPIFDLSTLTEPTVQLKIWLDCGSGDGAVLQSSIDSGLTWQNVGGFNDDENWFNEDFINANPGGQSIGWAGSGPSGDTENWFTAIHDLTELIGESNVIFRMAFGSDNTAFSNDGIAFDDFKIYSQDCYAGEYTNLFSCVSSSSGSLNLNDLLSEGVIPGGIWDQEGSNFNILNGVINLSDVDYTDTYNFTYTVNGENDCTDSVLIQLILQIIPDAGSDNTLTICTAREVSLNSYLDSNVNVNVGVWESLSEPTVPISDGIFSPLVADLREFGVGSYDFKYTMTSENCGEEDSSILTIVIEALSAGEDGVLDVCDTFTEEDLFNALEGDPGPGGVWSPIINGAGSYTYTQSATTNCLETSATVVVNEIVQLSAGIDTILESCNESSLEEFLDELGGDEGGIWSPSSYSDSGTYTYTHPATDCTVESSATIEFFIPNPPDAGEDNNVEGNFGSSNLNDLRGQLRSTDNNRRVDDGFWVQIQNGSPNVLISSDGEVDFPNTGAGAAQLYEFEYQVSGICADDVATLIVAIYGDDTAGLDGTLIICPGGNFTYSSLFNTLGGNPSERGYWLESIDGPGVYTYIAVDNSDFDADEATVTVIEETLKSAGLDGELPICEGDTPTELQLMDIIGSTANEGGTWEELSTGDYQYSHAATTCFPMVSAIVTIIEETPKSAGVSGELEICEGEIPTESAMLEVLGNTTDTGGTWEEMSSGDFQYSHAATDCYSSVSAIVTIIEETPKSAGVSGELEICEGETPTEPAMLAVLGNTTDTGGTWEELSTGDYQYSHAATDCYSSVSAIVTIIEETPKSAGVSGELEICEGETPTEPAMLAVLGNTTDTGGTWEELSTGDYQYSHSATTCFPMVSAIVTIIEETPKSAGLSGELEICEGETPTESAMLAVLGNTTDIGGTWEELSTGDYQYSHASTDCYSSVSAIVTIIEEAPKSAGLDGVYYICEGNPIDYDDMFETLGGTADPDGTWQLTSTGTYQYSHAATDCYEMVATEVTVNVQPQLSAGMDGTLVIPIGTIVTETQLFEALEGSPNVDGTWTPELAGANTYTYTHSEGVCVESTAQVIVTESGLSVNENELSSISFYPNPAKVILRIRNSNNVDIESIKIFNISGQLILSLDKNFSEINVSRLESAMYFLQVKSTYGQRTLKFIKE